MGPPPSFLEHIVVLCFERQYAKKIVLFTQNQTFCPPSNFLAGYATGFIKRLLRAAQKVLRSSMQLSEKCF